MIPPARRLGAEELLRLGHCREMVMAGFNLRGRRAAREDRNAALQGNMLKLNVTKSDIMTG